MALFQFQEEYSGAGRTAQVTRQGRVKVIEAPNVYENYASGSGNLNYVTNLDGDFKLNHVSVHFSAATSNAVTITLDSHLGSLYDVVLNTIAMSSSTDAIWIPALPLTFNRGDEIKVTWTNPGGIDYGMRIIYEFVGETTTTSTSTTISTTTTSSSTSTTVSTSTSSTTTSSSTTRSTSSSTSISTSTTKSTSTSITTTSQSTSTTQSTSTSSTTTSSSTSSTTTSSSTTKSTSTSSTTTSSSTSSTTTSTSSTRSTSTTKSTSTSSTTTSTSTTSTTTSTSTTTTLEGGGGE